MLHLDDMLILFDSQHVEAEMKLDIISVRGGGEEHDRSKDGAYERDFHGRTASKGRGQSHGAAAAATADGTYAQAPCFDPPKTVAGSATDI